MIFKSERFCARACQFGAMANGVKLLEIDFQCRCRPIAQNLIASKLPFPAQNWRQCCGFSQSPARVIHTPLESGPKGGGKPLAKKTADWLSHALLVAKKQQKTKRLSNSSLKIFAGSGRDVEATSISMGSMMMVAMQPGPRACRNF